MGTQLPLPKRGGGAHPQILGPCLLWPNSWIDQAGTWHGGRPHSGDFVLDGDTAPLPKKGTEAPPKFSARFYCGRTAGCIKMLFGMEVALSARDFVLDGDQPIPPKKGEKPPIFGPFLSRPNGWMDQDATWHGGTRGPTTPPQKWGGAPFPIFVPCLLWRNGWMDEGGTWHAGGPWPRPHCARWGSSSPPQKGQTSPPNFRAIFIVAKRLDGSRCHLACR